MKLHPLLKVSSVLYVLSGLVSLLTMVGFTIFGVLLAEEEDPTINILFLTAFILTALLACVLQMLAGINVNRGGSLAQARSLTLPAMFCNASAWLTGYLCSQIWYPFAAGILLCIFFMAGIKKEYDYNV